MHPKFNLLVIENEELALQPLASLAYGLGHRVIKSEGSDLPIAQMQKWRDHVQAIVLDWTLTCVMYGGPLIAELHRIEPDVPFIIVTGYGETLIRPLLPKTVRAHFLIKPFLSFDFENSIRCSEPRTLLR